MMARKILTSQKFLSMTKIIFLRMNLNPRIAPKKATTATTVRKMIINRSGNANSLALVCTNPHATAASLESGQ